MPDLDSKSSGSGGTGGWTCFCLGDYGTVERVTGGGQRGSLVFNEEE